MSQYISRLVKKRQLIKTLTAAAIATPLIHLAGCSGSGDLTSDASDDTDTSTSTSTDDTTNNSENTSTDTDTSTIEWASGGTASLQADFPPADPFENGDGDYCNLSTNAYTEGPCYFNPDEYRQDISEGELGVPMVLVLKLVDANCQPVANADIDIWHCNADGVYSGDYESSSDSSRFNARFCTGDDPAALQSKWFRGVQTTDENGLAFFKTCFPGWYPSRTTHIHFKVVRDGVSSLISQFCFDDNLCNEIYLSHVDYTGQEKDTTNGTDTVFGSEYPSYEFSIEKQTDGSMLGYKAIQLS